MGALFLCAARPFEAFLQGGHHVDHKSAARLRGLGGGFVAFSFCFDQRVETPLEFVVIVLDAESLGQVFDKLLGELYFFCCQLNAFGFSVAGGFANFVRVVHRVQREAAIVGADERGV